ncbi:FCP1 domain-containing protein [Gossypium arboreum]|uniref:Mitochondrial import inner membrane translocase subunit TIM50 n=1 Tax=Gossypium arboreum TaxID=29729 RepID=A0A0B0MK24_GOSAR|nr:FCP1 domain-containing protein [Gossypium arboreum]
MQSLQQLSASALLKSSVSDAKLSRSERKKLKKQRMERDIETRDGESLDKATCLGTEDVDLGAEQSSRSRKKRKRKENSFVESSGLKEEPNWLMNDTVSGRDSNVQTPENNVSESPLKGQSADSERKRKRKKKKSKMATSVEVDNSLVDEKNKSDSHLESGLEGAQLNEQTVQPESKRKKKKKKKGKGKKTTLNVMEDEDISSKSNGKDSNEVENGSRCTEPQIINEKNIRKEDPISISETVESKNTNKITLITYKQSDFSGIQNPRVDGDIVMPETEVIEKSKKVKPHHKKKKSCNLLGDGLEHVQGIGPIQISVEHREKEPTIGCSENGSGEVPVGHAMPAQASEEALGNNIGIESDLKGRKRKKRKKKSVWRPRKKLLVLDLNGILVDVVQQPNRKPNTRVDGKGVFIRPFCVEFLEFCFKTFNVGIWSSRVNRNMTKMIGFLLRKQWKRKLFFCWDRKLCTITKFKTLENEEKPLVLKELRKLWDRCLPELPWRKGDYDESNTLLLDDSPYKALRNPANTGIFPYPYQYTDADDRSLAPGGDIRDYLERIAVAENVQKFVEQNPFGQQAITEADPHWEFYSQVIKDVRLHAG